MAWQIYHAFKQRLLNGNAPDLDAAGTIVKIAILDNTHVMNLATHDFFDDVIADEVTGAGYTQGGNEVTAKTVTLNAGVVTFDAADPATWLQNAGGFSNGRFGVLYIDTGVDSTSLLIAINDFGSDFGNAAGDLTIELAVDGIFTLT